MAYREDFEDTRSIVSDFTAGDTVLTPGRIFAHPPLRIRPPEPEEFVVRAIIGHKPKHLTRTNIRRAYFRVYWEGYPRSESTWEHYLNLTIDNSELRNYLFRIRRADLVAFLEE